MSIHPMNETAVVIEKTFFFLTLLLRIPEHSESDNNVLNFTKII